MISYSEVMGQLESWGNPTRRKFNVQNGAGENQFGVTLGNLRAYAKKIKRNHALAMELWSSGNADAMILATMLMNPDEISAKAAADMIGALSYFVIVDEFIYNTVSINPDNNNAYLLWIDSDHELLERAGWNLIIAKILNQNTQDFDFDFLIRKIENEMKQAPLRKQESMNRCLCEIGIVLNNTPNVVLL